MVPDISEVSDVAVESCVTEGSDESAKSVAPVGKVLSVGNAESFVDDGAAPAVLLGKAWRSVFNPFLPL
jgi:hypothetical protein